MTNKARGQYKIPGGVKQVYRMTLDVGTADKLRTLGNGNLSLGVRMAAAFIDDWQKRGEQK